MENIKEGDIVVRTKDYGKNNYVTIYGIYQVSQASPGNITVENDPTHIWYSKSCFRLATKEEREAYFRDHTEANPSGKIGLKVCIPGGNVDYGTFFTESERDKDYCIPKKYIKHGSLNMKDGWATIIAEWGNFYILEYTDKNDLQVSLGFKKEYVNELLLSSPQRELEPSVNKSIINNKTKINGITIQFEKPLATITRGEKPAGNSIQGKNSRVAIESRLLSYSTILG